MKTGGKSPYGLCNMLSLLLPSLPFAPINIVEDIENE